MGERAERVFELCGGDYPNRVVDRLKSEAPRFITAIGSTSLLQGRLLGLICSTKCPGRIILEVHQAAKELVGSPWVVASGFHSPVEQECLRVFLRARHRIIVCPARSIQGMRISKQWDEMITDKRMLLLSPFDRGQQRITERSSVARNLFVAALAEKVWIPHVSSESKTERLRQRIEGWGSLIDLMEVSA